MSANVTTTGVTAIKSKRMVRARFGIGVSLVAATAAAASLMGATPAVAQDAAAIQSIQQQIQQLQVELRKLKADPPGATPS
jgi:Zn-dependent alcohol dehydrogenase